MGITNLFIRGRICRGAKAEEEAISCEQKWGKNKVKGVAFIAVYYVGPLMSKTFVLDSLQLLALSK